MIFSIFTFAGLMAVAVVLFTFWVGMFIVKLFWRTLTGNWEQNLPSAAGRHCMNPGCQTINPLHASFCRRCGAGLNDMAANRKPMMQQPQHNPANARGRQAASV